MICLADWWTWTPSATPLQPRKWNAHFCITFNFWCWPDWSMNSNPNYHPSPAKKMKCSFLDYIQLLKIGQAGWWTQTPSTTRLQPKKWNPHFCITLNFWWSAGLVDGLEPHLPPFSSQKNEMLIFGFCSTSDDWPGWLMDSNPIHHSSPAKKNEMLIFGLRSLLMICLADWWTWTSSATPLLPKNEMLTFWLRSTSDDQPSWSIDSKSICQPSPANKMKCFFLDYVHFWWSARLVDGLKPHLPPLSTQ